MNITKSPKNPESATLSVSGISDKGFSTCSYKGISLLIVAGKVYGRGLNDRMKKITEKNVGDEQGGFRKGRGCVDQIFALIMLVEKIPREE